jgi:molecular chaperone DnaK
MVHRGECELVHDNKLLRNFQLVGIPPAHRGVPHINADSIAHASATYKVTSKDQSVTISPGSGLSNSEIQSVLEVRGADKAHRAMNVGFNRADSVAEKALKDFEDKLNKNEAENIKEKITAPASRLSSSRSRLMPFGPLR